MNEIVKYIHLGYPKNFSTSLQRLFFDKHPEIMHLGIGCHNDNTKYLNKKISAAVEMHLRYSKEFIFKSKAKEIKAEFQKQFELAKNNGFKAVGLSAEILSIGFTPQDIDVVVKANRLLDIFGEDTKIIFILRNQVDLMKSFYKECIRLGYPYSFEEFIDFHFKYHCKSFSSDLFYFDTINYYQKLFSKKNILVLFYEELIDNKTRQIKKVDGKNILVKNLSDFLALEQDTLSFGHLNNAMTDSELYYKRELNKKYQHDISNILYDFMESHRLNAYFSEELKTAPYKPDYKDVKTKRISIEQAKKLSILKKRTLKINEKTDSFLRLNKMFAESNKKLNTLLSVDIKELGYPI